MATYEQKQSQIHAIEENISSLAVLLMNEVNKLSDVLNEVDNGVFDYRTPKGNTSDTIFKTYKTLKNIAEEFDNGNDIMSDRNGHNSQLVKEVNKLYADVTKRAKFRNALYNIMAIRHINCVKEKLNLSITDFIHSSPNEFFERYSWDALVHIFDDSDLERLIQSCI